MLNGIKVAMVMPAPLAMMAMSPSSWTNESPGHGLFSAGVSSSTGVSLSAEKGPRHQW